MAAFAVQKQSGVVPFPMRYQSRLTYGVNVTTSTAGSSAFGTLYKFRLSSLFDPDQTGTGHQPYQYDQLAAVYTKYLVRHCVVDLTFTDPTVDGLWVGWSVVPEGDAGDTPTSLTLEDFVERPNWRCMPLNNTGAQTVTCKMSIPIHTVFGLTPGQYENQTSVFGAAYNNNPTSVAYLQCFVVDPTALVSQQSVRIAGRLVYTSDHFSYTAPAQS
jgi:hypothetical protein